MHASVGSAASLKLELRMPPAHAAGRVLQVQAAVAAAEAALGPIDLAFANAGVAIMGARALPHPLVLECDL